MTQPMSEDESCEDERFICEICLRDFTSQKGLVTHKGMSHKNEIDRRSRRKAQQMKYDSSFKGKQRTNKYEKSLKGFSRRQRYRYSTKGKQTQVNYKRLKKQLQEDKKKEQRMEQAKKQKEIQEKKWLQETEEKKKFFRQCDLNRFKHFTFTADDLRFQKIKWKQEFGTDDYYNDSNQCLKIVEKTRPIENMHAERKFISGWYICTRNYVAGMKIEYVRKEQKDFVPLPIHKVTLIEFQGVELLVKHQKGWQYEIRLDEVLIKLPCEPIPFAFNWSVC